MQAVPSKLDAQPVGAAGPRNITSDLAESVPSDGTSRLQVQGQTVVTESHAMAEHIGLLQGLEAPGSISRAGDGDASAAVAGSGLSLAKAWARGRRREQRHRVHEQACML